MCDASGVWSLEMKDGGSRSQSQCAESRQLVAGQISDLTCHCQISVAKPAAELSRD